MDFHMKHIDEIQRHADEQDVEAPVGCKPCCYDGPDRFGGQQLHPGDCPGSFLWNNHQRTKLQLKVTISEQSTLKYNSSTTTNNFDDLEK